MKKEKKIIIFTDLDGTLLNPLTYSYQVAKPLIKKLKKKRIPIIFCTAKTRAENEYYQKKLKIADPFVVENGGAIFIPKNYFGFSFHFDKAFRNYLIIELGTNYQKLRKTLKRIRKETGFRITGFGDMTLKEVAKDSGLPEPLAKLAKMKEYNESFKFLESLKKEKILRKKIKKYGLKLTQGGRYYNIIGKDADKGKAVEILTKLYKKDFRRLQTIGLGDSQNDLPMLKAVEVPILVQKPSGLWDPIAKDIPGLIRIKEIGPKGWVKAIKKYVLN
jgi:mannosyl-3-phosphoglycerate phosphatase